MTEKQMRVSNILLFLILVVLIINLVVDLVPYIITGSMLGLLRRSKIKLPSISISRSTPAQGEGFIIIDPTVEP